MNQKRVLTLNIIVYGIIISIIVRNRHRHQVPKHHEAFPLKHTHTQTLFTFLLYIYADDSCGEPSALQLSSA